MVKSRHNIFFCNKNIYSEQEENFKNAMLSLFYTRVRFTLFERGGNREGVRQYNLWIMIDENHDVKITRDAYSWGNNTISVRGLGEIQEKTIVDLYFQHLKNEPEEKHEVILKFCDLTRELLKYAYGNAQGEIRSILYERYGVDQLAVLVKMDEPVMYINPPDLLLRTVLEHKDDILKICYKCLKKHDDYNIVSKAYLNVHFYSDEEMRSKGLEFLKQIN